MITDDLENELRNLRSIHLTESELVAYCDRKLDPIPRALAEAHLKQCFICERQLALLREETAALDSRQITAEDVALVDRLLERTALASKPSASSKEIPPRERLAEYLRQMVENWRISFGRGALRGEADESEEVWRWQSEDSRLQARAVMEKNADLTIHFTSSEMELEGARLRFRLGRFSQELTLQRKSESEVVAQVAVPWQYRQSNMADISIEVFQRRP
jgi:hypothetical protein